MTNRADKARVLVVHNAYQLRGGEDVVCEAEIDLLRDRGHEVEVLCRHNDELRTASKVVVAAETVWSSRSSAAFEQATNRFMPDVVHVHNTFPMISPSVFWAAARRGVPVVQTLHNFRLLCPQAMFLREGRVCEQCIRRFPWPAVAHRCYRGSIAQTSVLAAMLGVHRTLGTYQEKITRYIALSEFSRRKFIEGGLPASKVVVKPNFVDVLPPPSAERNGILFVGRLTQEKGIEVLASAATRLAGIDMRVAGDGPDAYRLRGIGGVVLLGAVDASRVRDLMVHALALILPSICYENFPRTLAEAFANGLPVIASRIGSLAELVRDGVTGLLFEPGDSDDLARKASWALANRVRMQEMGSNARAEYEAKYSAERNYAALMEIYEDAIAGAKLRRA